MIKIIEMILCATVHGAVRTSRKQYHKIVANRSKCGKSGEGRHGRKPFPAQKSCLTTDVTLYRGKLCPWRPTIIK